MNPNPRKYTRNHAVKIELAGPHASQWCDPVTGQWREFEELIDYGIPVRSFGIGGPGEQGLS
jgi:hypothetical protein